MSRRRRLIVLCSALVCVCLCDQLIKAWACAALVGSSFSLIEHVVVFQLVFNTGAAFSLGSGAQMFFVGLALVVTVLVCIFVWRCDATVLCVVAVGLIAGGGLSNAYDRVMFGHVIDYISLVFINFPVFNIADVCVTFGAVGAFSSYWQRSRLEDRKRS